MKDTQREILENYESEYISIGITDDGEPYSATRVPWERTGNAFNMKIPKLYIAKDDLNDEALMERLRRLEVIGMYIYSALDDYSFISSFPHIRDLNIYNGVGIKELSFLESLECCRMLSIRHAELPDLEPIVRIKSRKRGGGILMPLICVFLYDCKVADIRGLGDKSFYFSEFIVASPREREERERWRGVAPGVLKYYDIG